MRFSIIYADPPWEYDDTLGNDPKYGGITYKTMPIDQICNIPVRDIRADNSVLFMWATFPKLEEAFRVIRRWGFQYVTVGFVWLKVYKNGIGKSLEELESKDIVTGTGRWTNSNSEICLIGRHGKISRVSTIVKQTIIAPLLEHSAKPPEVRERIVQLMGDLPRVELFARDLTLGWTCLGNEVDGNDIRDSIEFLAYLSTSV